MLLLTPLQPHRRQHKPHDQSLGTCTPDHHVHLSSPSALHSPLKPERSAIGAVIRLRFTLPAALHPTQRHHFTWHHQLSTTTHTCPSSRPRPQPIPEQITPQTHPPPPEHERYPPHTSTSVHFLPAHQPRHPTPGPFLSTQPMIRSGRLHHSSNASFASPATSTAAGNTKARTTRFNQASAFGIYRAASHTGRRVISEAGFYREIRARRPTHTLRFLLNLRKARL